MADTPSIPTFESLSWRVDCTGPAAPLSYPEERTWPVPIEEAVAAPAWQSLVKQNPELAAQIVRGETATLPPLTVAFLKGEFDPVIRTVWKRLYEQAPAWKALGEKEKMVPKVSRGSNAGYLDSRERRVLVSVTWDTTGVPPNQDDGWCGLDLEFKWARHPLAKLIDQTLSGKWPLSYLPPEKLMGAIEDAIRDGDRETALNALRIVAQLHNHAVEGDPFILKNAGEATNRLRAEIARQTETPRFASFVADTEYPAALLAARIQIERDSDNDNVVDYQDKCPRLSSCK